MSTKGENIRHGRGKSFETEVPRGFSGIEAIVSWCDDGDGNLVVVPEGSQPLAGTK